MANNNEKINSYSGVVPMGTEKFGGPGFFASARSVRVSDALGQVCGILGFGLSATAGDTPSLVFNRSNKP